MHNFPDHMPAFIHERDPRSSADLDIWAEQAKAQLTQRLLSGEALPLYNQASRPTRCVDREEFLTDGHIEFKAGDVARLFDNPEAFGVALYEQVKACIEKYVDDNLDMLAREEGR